MPIQLLAIDIDGTLALRDAEVSDANVAAVKRAFAAGIRVVLATGRRHRTTRAVADRIDEPMALVCLGGALVKDHDDATVASEPLPRGTMAELLRIGRDHEQALVLQADRGEQDRYDFLVDTLVPWNELVARYCESHAEHAGTLSADTIPDDILVASAFGSGQEMAALQAEIHACLPEVTTVVVESGSAGHYLEVTASRVDKWSGLTRLASHLGIDRSAIAAIGDQLNDIPMLRNAALAIAMGDGHQEVRRHAHHVTRRHDEDGVAHAIDWLLRQL